MVSTNAVEGTSREERGRGVRRDSKLCLGHIVFEGLKGGSNSIIGNIRLRAKDLNLEFIPLKMTIKSMRIKRKTYKVVSEERRGQKCMLKTDFIITGCCGSVD